MPRGLLRWRSSGALGMFKDNDGLSGNITLIGTFATSVSMSARRLMPGTGRGRDRRLPSAGGK